MINRHFHYSHVAKRLKSSQIVAILGPRQCGKTTLAKEFKSELFLDLERPQDLALLQNPEQSLKGIKGLIIIDEIQRAPELFPYLRHFVDNNSKARLIVLGSSSRALIKQSSESLAGRISYYQLSGFSDFEIESQFTDRLWLRGGFPKSFLARSEALSQQWRQDYIRTFLEQDIPQLGIQIPANTLRRFWSLLAHYNGQLLNYSEIGRVFGISDTTVKKYIDILAGTFMVDALSPWFANIAKRQVKSSKFYFSDTGVFHSLAKIDSRMDLLAHPRLGSSWETFVLASIRSQFRGEIFFWGTQSDAEIDFIIETKKGLIGIEAKFTDQPKITPSMRIALADLELEFIYVVYPGERSFMLSDKIKVIPLHLLSGALSF